MSFAAGLPELAALYEPKDPQELADLAGDFRRRQEAEILEIASIAAEVQIDSVLNAGLEPGSDPLLKEALKRQYPNLNLDSLAGMSEEQLQGVVNGVKGKYFELLVAERLNHGDSVGELHLGPGQVARLSDDPTEAGWDVEIVNTEDGSMVELLQLKATESMGYVKSALEKYPEFRVATTSEVEGVSEAILQTDISDAEIEDVTGRYVGELAESDFTDALHGLAEWGLDAFPLLPAIMIATVEGRRVLIGRSRLDESLRRGAKQLRGRSAFSVLGATLVALDAGALSGPVTSISRIAWKRIANQMAMGDLLEAKTKEISAVAAA